MRAIKIIEIIIKKILDSNIPKIKSKNKIIKPKYAPNLFNLQIP